MVYNGVEGRLSQMCWVPGSWLRLCRTMCNSSTIESKLFLLDIAINNTKYSETFEISGLGREMDKN